MLTRLGNAGWNRGMLVLSVYTACGFPRLSARNKCLSWWLCGCRLVLFNKWF